MTILNIGNEAFNSADIAEKVQSDIDFSHGSHICSNKPTLIPSCCTPIMKCWKAVERS